jgi:fumarate hydratase class II
METIGFNASSNNKASIIFRLNALNSTATGATNVVGIWMKEDFSNKVTRAYSAVTDPKFNSVLNNLATWAATDHTNPFSISKTYTNR